MANWSFRLREWVADRSRLQYPKLRRIEPVRATPEFKFKDFAIAMKALGLAAVCLITGILLLFFCGSLIYAIIVGLTG